jgi:hypothetical protein
MRYVCVACYVIRGTWTSAKYRQLCLCTCGAPQEHSIWHDKKPQRHASPDCIHLFSSETYLDEMSHPTPALPQFLEFMCHGQRGPHAHAFSPSVLTLSALTICCCMSALIGFALRYWHMCLRTVLHFHMLSLERCCHVHQRPHRHRPSLAHSTDLRQHTHLHTDRVTCYMQLHICARFVNVTFPSARICASVEKPHVSAARYSLLARACLCAAFSLLVESSSFPIQEQHVYLAFDFMCIEAHFSRSTSLWPRLA